VLLSVGANDIDFSGLVADVIVDSATERTLFRQSGVIGSVGDSRAALARDLPQGFAKLREALKPLVGNLPARGLCFHAKPDACQWRARAPAPRRLRYSSLVQMPSRRRPQQRIRLCAERNSLPQLKAIVTCGGGVMCRDPLRDRMTFVDAHQGAFRCPRVLRAGGNRSGIRSRMFFAAGREFRPGHVSAASQPMLCGRGAGDYRAYLPRARWIRDANDSYFAAMTYPQALPSSSPARRYPRRHLGRVVRSLWRRRAPHRRRPRRGWRTRRCLRPRRLLALDAAEPEVTVRPLEPAGAVPAQQ